MALATKLLKGIVTFGADGAASIRPLAASSVLAADGTTTAQAHMDDASLHTSISDINAGIDSKIAAAVGLLEDGADGSSLAEKYDSLKKIGDALDATNGVLNTFLDQETDNGVVDTLKELLAEIAANKNNIDALVSDKVSASDIVNDLVTDDAEKVLSAAQGVALKALIDALDAEVTDAIAALHTHANLAVLDGIAASTVITNGLTYNGAELNLLPMIEMTESEAAALTARPANLHPNGQIFIVADPTPAP